jgi:ABC-type multidrug transport system fused ATPase/permease subunit
VVCLVRLFRPYLKENRSLMVLAGACGLGATLMRLLRPWPLKLIFDGVLVPAESMREHPLLSHLFQVPASFVIGGACFALLVISLLWGLFSSRQSYLTAKAGQQVVYSLRRRVYAHLQRLSLGFHQRRRRGDLVMRLTGDLNVLRDLLVDSILLGLSEGLLLLSMVAVMLVMNWKLTLIALIILPLMGLTSLSFSIRIRDAARRQRKNEGRIAAMLNEMLSNIHLTQAFGRERYQERHFREGNRKSLKAGLRTTRLEAAMSRTVELLLAVGTASVLWYGAQQVRTGVLTPGDLLVFISYLGSSYRPLRKLARISARMSKAVVCAERVTEVLESSPKVKDLFDARRIKRLEGRIEFRRVAFKYSAGRRALRQISFSVEPGEFVGIVGPTGSGKSTLLALLLRLYDPRRGKILLDGRNLRRYRLQSLRDHISVVLQEPILFGATIRENLAFARPEAADKEIQRGARRANAHDFIRNLPDGYDTPMAEAGANLSLGQRQRLSIARAFLRDAPILLLDEPVNGLDATTEREVTRGLRRLRRGRTTLMVAHKLSTVRDADRILVVKRGRVLEQGSHDELMTRNGWYARSFRLQQPRAHTATRFGPPSGRERAELPPVRSEATG